MFPRVTRCFAGLVASFMVTGLLIGPAAAAAPRAQQGVTKDAIQIALIVPDFDTYKAKGLISGPAAQSNADYARKFSAYVDAYGPINGRKVVLTTIPWNFDDPTSGDKVCTAATQDNKPLVVIAASAFRSASVPCISADNKTPLFTGDMQSDSVLKVSGKNLLTLGLPAEVDGRAAAQLLATTKDLPKTAKIGILSDNEPAVQAGGNSLASELKKQGYKVVSKIELNGLSNDPSVTRREAASAVDTFHAAGVDTVINANAWGPMNAFLGGAVASGQTFKIYNIDAQSNGCFPGSVVGAPAAATGATCITYWDTHALATRDGIKKDNPLEAKCRGEFDQVNTKSVPGGPPSPQLINGTVYRNEFGFTECNIASVLLPAIKKAGKDVTWAKVYANILATTKTPAAYMNNGNAGFGPKKPYLAAPLMHLEVASVPVKGDPPDVHGLYSGCPTPANCWIPKLVKGQEWFRVKG